MWSTFPHALSHSFNSHTGTGNTGTNWILHLHSLYTIQVILIYLYSDLYLDIWKFIKLKKNTSSKVILCLKQIFFSNVLIDKSLIVQIIKS